MSKKVLSSKRGFVVILGIIAIAAMVIVAIQAWGVSPIEEEREVTTTIVEKEIWEVPFLRIDKYYLHLGTGGKVEVSKETYDEASVGDTITLRYVKTWYGIRIEWEGVPS